MISIFNVIALVFGLIGTCAGYFLGYKQGVEDMFNINQFANDIEYMDDPQIKFIKIEDDDTLQKLLNGMFDKEDKDND